MALGGPVDTHLFCWQVPLSQLAYGPSALPQILYNPAQQILAYTGFCPSPATLPTCSSYPLPLQVGLVLPGRSQWAHITGCSRPGQPWSDGTQMGVHGLPSPSLLGQQSQHALARDGGPVREAWQTARPLQCFRLLCWPGPWHRPGLEPFLTQARTLWQFTAESRPATRGLCAVIWRPWELTLQPCIPTEVATSQPVGHMGLGQLWSFPEWHLPCLPVLSPHSSLCGSGDPTGQAGWLPGVSVRWLGAGIGGSGARDMGCGMLRGLLPAACQRRAHWVRPEWCAGLLLVLSLLTWKMRLVAELPGRG